MREGRLAHWPAHRRARLAKARNPSLFVHPSIQNTCGGEAHNKAFVGLPMPSPINASFCLPSIYIYIYMLTQYVYYNLWLSKDRFTHVTKGCEEESTVYDFSWSWVCSSYVQEEPVVSCR